MSHLGVLKIVPPQGADFVLTTNIPHSEADVFVFNRFNVKTNSWDGGDNFSQL